jgi:hypothetical protein
VLKNYSVKGIAVATRHGGACWERWYSSYSFLTSALGGGEWSELRPDRSVVSFISLDGYR